MKKATAIGILTVMALGLSGWAGSQIVANTNGISKLQERTSTTKEMVHDIYVHLLKKEPKVTNERNK